MCGGVSCLGRNIEIMIWDSGNFLLVISAIFLTASELLLCSEWRSLVPVWMIIHEGCPVKSLMIWWTWPVVLHRFAPLMSLVMEELVFFFSCWSSSLSSWMLIFVLCVSESLAWVCSLNSVKSSSSRASVDVQMVKVKDSLGLLPRLCSSHKPRISHSLLWLLAGGRSPQTSSGFFRALQKKGSFNIIGYSENGAVCVKHFIFKNS